MRRFQRMAAVALGVTLLGAATLVLVEVESVSAQVSDAEVRIAARRVADGRIEFGLQHRGSSGSWSDRELPSRRFLPTSASIGRWLSSSPLEVPAAEVRIVARRLSDGRVEFGLQQRLSESWNERQLPSRRFFPADTAVGRWLTSSPLEFGGVSASGESGDPLGLVAEFEFTSAYSLGQDVWDVWLCDTPSGDLFSEDLDARFNPANYAASFKSRVTPWFDWLSNGAYEPVFRAGGVVRAPGAEADACEDAVIAAALHNDANGVLIVSANEMLTADGVLGYGWCGLYSRRTWPDSGRAIVLDSASFRQPQLVAHELGHALCWPHSFTGGEVNDGVTWEYDNTMDQMSRAYGDRLGGPAETGTLTVGTIAFNRYAAGWIDPSNVEIHTPGTTRDYQLAPPGESGTQMLVLPDPETGTRGVFAALGARNRGAGGSQWHDAEIGAEGVEIYWIDQTEQACAMPDRRACHGLDRRTVPLDAAPYTTDHVIAEGGGFYVISGYEITVGEYSSVNKSYPVSVRPLDTEGWAYATDPTDGAWSSARLQTNQHNLYSPYGVVTLDVTCSADAVGALIYFWSQHIDWNYTLGEQYWYRAVNVSYRFGDSGQEVAAQWVITGDSQGVFVPAAELRDFVADLMDSADPLHISLWRSNGTEIGVITFPAATDTDGLARVIRDCGANTASEVPVQAWLLEYDNSDALHGDLPLAYVLSFEHDLPAPYNDQPAALYVQCNSGFGRPTVRVIVYLGGAIMQGNQNNRINVSYRFDDESILNREWAPSTNLQYIFLDQSENRVFLTDLQRHSSLVWRVWDPAGEQVGTVTFSSLAGAEEAITFVETDCR